MDSNTHGLYTAFKTKDQRLDGRYFVGISSTGIYCRPICKAKQPKEINCTFFHSAAEAEQAGYRPCLMCRPELAPGNSLADANKQLSYRTAKFLEENCSQRLSMEEVANKLGYTDRHLRRVFKNEYNVSPIQYLQTCRLHLAKQLLTDTNLSVLTVAMTSGFGSLRQFNATFKTQYKLTPSQLRKKRKPTSADDSITLSLSYHPPYRWTELLLFFKNRAIAGIEQVDEHHYMRTIQLKNSQQEPFHGWIKVTQNNKKKALDLTISHSLLGVLPQVIAQVKKQFDLACDPETIYDSLNSMNEIIPNSCITGIRLPGCFDSFEMSVRAILGQLISVKAANTIAKRIVKAFGPKIQTEFSGLTHLFPTPEVFLALENIQESLGQLGVTAAKSNSIYQLADYFVTGKIKLDYSVQPEVEMKEIQTIKGIGSWTAQYIAMRTMGWTDAFLETDVGVKNAVAPLSTKEFQKIAGQWHPWRSYVVLNLWNTL
ncbi:AlkA N-terminal domain-containing protein [Enterococcus sp. LJL99]